MGVSKHKELPDEWRGIFGTLAHNRSFTANELQEYVFLDPEPNRRSAGGALKKLVAMGLIKAVERTKSFVPTSEGWNWIEQRDEKVE
jgi:hypothetical protein